MNHDKFISKYLRGLLNFNYTKIIGTGFIQASIFYDLKFYSMKDKTLNKSVNDYVNSLEKVFEKRKQWKEFAFPLLIKILHEIRENHEIGWQVQELNWLMNNKAVNISFVTFPKSLIDKWNGAVDIDFIKGAALVFSQKYNGDVSVFIIYPDVAESAIESNIKDIGIYNPNEFNENFIMNKVTLFLEEIIVWEENVIKHKVGF